jgi:hypothetical protein
MVWVSFIITLSCFTQFSRENVFLKGQCHEMVVEFRPWITTVGGLEIETCITVSRPPSSEDTAL